MNLLDICLFILQNYSTCLNYNLGPSNKYDLCIPYLDHNYHLLPFSHHIISCYYSTRKNNSSHSNLCNRSFFCIFKCTLKSQNINYCDSICSNIRVRAGIRHSWICFLQGRCRQRRISLGCSRKCWLSNLNFVNILILSLHSLPFVWTNNKIY